MKKQKMFPRKSVEDWLNNLRELINRYELKDIFNTDEIGLYLLLIKTLSFTGNEYKKWEKNKDWLTVL